MSYSSPPGVIHPLVVLLQLSALPNRSIGCNRAIIGPKVLLKLGITKILSVF
jgi:hypothetical protein